MKKQPWHVAIGLAALAAAALTAAALTKTPPTNLLLRAKPIADTSHWFWSGGTDEAGGDTYFWLSDHEILHPNAVYDITPTFYCYNTRTRREAHVPSLDYLVPPATMIGLSPDHETLIYALGLVTPRQFAAAKIDSPLTARHQEHPFAYAPEHAAWMPDSKHIVEVESSEGNSLLIKDLDNKVVQTISIPQSACNNVMGVTPQGHVVLGREIDFRGSDLSASGTPLFEDVDCRSSPPRVRAYAYSPPVVGGDVDGIVRLSPDGSRLAWLCQTRATVHPVFLPVLDSLPPALNPCPRDQVQIFISDPDGSKMQEIGRLPLSRDDPNFPMAIQWTPDSEAVSFAYRGRLYVLPV